MKIYSDTFSGLTGMLRKAAARIATTALLMVAAITIAFAQEPYSFIEGSTHKFHVTPGDVNNALAWSMYVDPYNNIQMSSSAYSIADNTLSDVAVTFTDLSRTSAELCYLVVQETSSDGCSTRRAIQIQLQPNNMYLDFASAASTADCYSGDNYQAEVKVGMNFNVRNTTDNTPIPESYFPLQVTYTVLNQKTNETATHSETINYDATNNYYLTITDTKGSATEDITYTIAITEVTDKYQTKITHEEQNRIQIRVINHLPQTNSMDMAMAYVVTNIY